MKIYRYLLGAVLISSLLFSCSKEFDRPPLNEPTYTVAEANITIAKLKSLYKDIVDPTIIETDFIIKGIVIGNDESGNIYKQLYIQDETGGINIGIDQNSMYTQYRIGQEMIIHVKGLAMVKYGEQLQIGYNKTNANRIPWEVFQLQAHKNGWPMADKAQPKTITLNQVDESMVNTLIKLENVYFVDGGSKNFSESDATTNRILKDGNGRQIIVRNSNYASFAANTLPSGAGTIVAVLSKFRNDWQLLIRTIDDVQNFGQPIPGGDTTKPTDPIVVPPVDPNPNPTPVPAGALLASWADFEDWAVFKKSLNSYGLKDYAIQSSDARNGSKSLSIKATPTGNDYVFTAVASETDNLVGKKKITFWIKGNSAKSLSINVYTDGTGFTAFNLEDVSADKDVSPAADGKNQYTGVINTNGKWIKVTLDLSSLTITNKTGNLIAFKVGKEVAYDLVIDYITVE